MNLYTVKLQKLIAVTIAFAFLFSCKFKEEGFHISGEIKNLPINTKLFFEEMEYNNVITLDTTKTDKKGYFELKGFLKHDGLYRIRFGNDKYIMLVMNEKPQDVKIKADTSSFLKQPYSIDGSATSVQLQDFLLNISKRYSVLQEVIAKIHSPSISDSLKKIYENEIQQRSADARDFITQYVDTVANPVIGIFAVSNFLNPQTDIASFEKASEKWKKNYSDVPMVKSFVENVATLKQQENPGEHPMFANGAELPDIEINDINGNPLKLSSFRGKYVLVDFWASWCGPCRAENPNVVTAYNEYKDKGFTVYSVSLDDDKAKWQKAIEKDKLSWANHVSELKGWQSQIVRDFGIGAIPTNYLIDKEGKVIASDLRGAELENILRQTLK